MMNTWHRMHPSWQKAEGGRGGGGMKKMALGSRFQKLRGPLQSGGQRGTKFMKGARFMMAIMFFCKRVISVATLLLIIHITMYILKSYYKMIPYSKPVLH